MSLSAPTRLDRTHDLNGFECGVPALDDWLKRRARNNAAQGATHTYVVTEAALPPPSPARRRSSPITRWQREPLPSQQLRRNMPDPVPVVVLDRLAIDRRYHGLGLGRALFRDAGLRVLAAADIIGVRALLVDPISEDAKTVYLKLGMQVSPVANMTLMAMLAHLLSTLVKSRCHSRCQHACPYAPPRQPILECYQQVTINRECPTHRNCGW